MRTLPALLLATLLTACAMTPNDVRLMGIAGRFERPAPPPDVAACLARNLRNVHGSVTVWTDPQPYGRIDVGGRTEDYGTAVLFEISPKDAGAVVFVYLNAQMFASDRDKVAAQFMQAC